MLSAHFSIRTFLSIVFAIFLIACTSQRALVVERSGARKDATVLPPVEPGFYRVKRGDTLYRIALDQGQSYRDIAQWSNLSNPDQIEVDQVLRVQPLVEHVPKVVVGGPIRSGVLESKVLAHTPGKEAAKEKSALANDKDVSQEPVKEVATEMHFMWPAKGAVLARFDEAKNKGVDIGGKAGDPVKAAGNGKVVYAGSGLRGYGNLIIIKHDNTYLTAYAHNRALIAKEGDQVKSGQTIAEMGESDADRVKLHFEVRRNGKPVDPLRFLPEKP
ncbi:MAG: peptidoglycan DD-metalloendopeptidase family protein [Ottowia sp.]|nr:peptidoglycan DD-metalloendopeptidase family protein [Ottowia sp.]